MTEKLYPLGTIVYLKEGTAKLMIVGRGAQFKEDNVDKFSDYIGVLYPNGINPENALFFNHEDIDEVVFEGFSDEEEERYLVVYEEWKNSLTEE
ncbi:MAG: DUF4176 domain-containing protein [Lactobacillus sp.]|nr:DUF4176 domain-containing protein [Lactobacillus sp.]